MKHLRTVLWNGSDFTTLCTFEGRRLTQFECLYLLHMEDGLMLKKRLWREGVLVSSSLLARYGQEWLRLFAAARADFASQAKNIAESPSRSNTCSPLTRHVPQMGEPVTSLRPRSAYYSHYAGLPYCSFEPGDVGVVGAVDVPAVIHNPENPSDLFACIDFKKPGLPDTERRGTGPREWRCHLYYHQMLPLIGYGVRPAIEAEQQA